MSLPRVPSLPFSDSLPVNLGAEEAEAKASSRGTARGTRPRAAAAAEIKLLAMCAVITGWPVAKERHQRRGL